LPSTPQLWGLYSPILLLSISVNSPLFTLKKKKRKETTTEKKYRQKGYTNGLLTKEEK
jgi:hypothetical protein